MPTIQIKNGPGITFNDSNAITINANTSNGLMEKKTDGLYVSSLNGNDGGGSGGSSADGITTYSSGETISINGNYVQYIFSMGMYKVDSRSATEYVVTEEIKDIDDILAECNANSSLGLELSSYIMRTHDLFMLKVEAHPTVNVGKVRMDDGNRYNNDICAALFVVDDISFDNNNPYFMTKLSITCLWKSTASLGDAFSIGKQYTAPHTYTI